MYVCTTCESYLCVACHKEKHEGNTKSSSSASASVSSAAVTHVPRLISETYSYIDYDSSNDGCSYERRHLGAPRQADEARRALTFNGCSTLYECFWKTVREGGERPFLGTRSEEKPDGSGPYVWQTYAQVAKRAENIAAALNKIGLAEKSRVGLCSVNRAEWIIAEQACFTNNLITVPLYDTLGADSIEQIVAAAEVECVVCSVDKKQHLIDVARRQVCLKTLIIMPTRVWDAALKPKAATPAQVQPKDEGASSGSGDSAELPSHLQIVDFLALEKQGAELNASTPLVHRPPKPDDFSTFCYTSGTTGKAKGAQLSHANFVSDAAAVCAHGREEIVARDDVHASYLPLSHAFERIIFAALIASGGCAGFYRGSPLLLLDDVAALRPTLFCSVPRVFNKLYAGVMANVRATGGVKAWLFNKALQSKLQHLEQGWVTHKLWDALVFKKVAARLGGRVRLMVTGSAPISEPVIKFLRVAFSCHVVEGYGQTESCAGSTVTLPGDNRGAGNVGVPLTCNAIKLVDVPEMSYTCKDVLDGAPCPRGEICFRGPNVFAGYYKDAELTAEALDADGWLHSGDIGCWLPDQTLKIIDRKKNIFKTSLGEYIAPEKIENVVVRTASGCVEQVFVTGDSLESVLVAIVVPAMPVIQKFAAEHGIQAADSAALLADARVNAFVLKEMDAAGRAAQLKGFELPKAVHLHGTPFSVDNDLLTPTFKLKRSVAQKVFADQIAAMYQQLNQQH